MTVAVGKKFYVSLAVLMTGLVLVGFWPSYFGVLLSGGEYERHWVFHVHAVVFLGWMAALIVQAVLAARRQTKAHMALGRSGFLLGIAVLLMGLIVSAVVIRDGYARGAIDAWGQAVWFASAPLMDITQFGILLGLGWSHRRKIEFHRRYMVLATIAILPAATARSAWLLGPWSFELLFLALVSVVAARDLYMDRRLHAANIIGVLILLPRLVLNISYKIVG